MAARNHSPAQRATYNVVDVAERLGCHPNTVYEMVRQNELPGVIRLRPKIVFAKRPIDALLNGEPTGELTPS